MTSRSQAGKQIYVWEVQTKFAQQPPALLQSELATPTCPAERFKLDTNY